VLKQVSLDLVGNFDPTGLVTIASAFMHPSCSNIKNAERVDENRKVYPLNQAEIALDSDLCTPDFSISKTVAGVVETIQVNWKCMPEDKKSIGMVSSGRVRRLVLTISQFGSGQLVEAAVRRWNLKVLMMLPVGLRAHTTSSFS